MCSDVNKRYHVWLWAKSLCLTKWLKVTDERRDRGAHDDSIYMRCYWQVQVMTTHHWISHGWTNNNYELYNHVLKSKNGVTWNAWRTWSTTSTLWLNFNWRIFVVPSTVPATTHCADRFTCHHVTYQAWHAMSDERGSGFLPVPGKFQQSRASQYRGVMRPKNLTSDSVHMPHNY